MNPIFDFSRVKFDVQLRKLLQTFGEEMPHLLTQQMRLLLEKIIAFTPPKSKRQGTVATRRDISFAVKPLNIDSFRSPKLKKIVNERDYSAFEVWARHVNSERLRNAVAAPWSPTLHTSRRDHRGRVLHPRKMFVLGRPDRGALRNYVKRKTDNVGIAVSGWLAALHLLGRRESAYVERHGTRFGQVIDERKDPVFPSVTAMNRTPWAHRKDEGRRIIRNAMNSRANAMRTYLAKLVELAKAKSGM